MLVDVGEFVYYPKRMGAKRLGSVVRPQSLNRRDGLVAEATEAPLFDCLGEPLMLTTDRELILIGGCLLCSKNHFPH